MAEWFFISVCGQMDVRPAVGSYTLALNGLLGEKLVAKGILDISNYIEAYPPLIEAYYFYRYFDFCLYIIIPQIFRLPLRHILSPDISNSTEPYISNSIEAYASLRYFYFYWSSTYMLGESLTMNKSRNNWRLWRNSVWRIRTKLSRPHKKNMKKCIFA